MGERVTPVGLCFTWRFLPSVRLAAGTATQSAAARVAGGYDSIQGRRIDSLFVLMVSGTCIWRENSFTLGPESLSRLEV